MASNAAPKVTPSNKSKIKPHRPFPTHYESAPVPLPADYLSPTPPADCPPAKVWKVDFKNTVIPEYKGCYAVVIDGVMSKKECEDYIQYAELASGRPAEEAWQPALVNVGGGMEALVPDYRNSERIIWDAAEVVNRLWERVRVVAPDVVNVDLKGIDGDQASEGWRLARRGEKWRFTRVNERMRVLKYGPGMFFAEHCDGAYANPNHKSERTFYTLHLYLNDSVQAYEGKEAQGTMPDPKPTLRGGATPFLSLDSKRRIDVDPKVGRVLIFQHRGLLHAGAEVLTGTKFTVRSDLLFERIEDDEKGEEKMEK